MSYNNGSTHDKSMTNSYTIEFVNGDSGKSSSRHRKILGSSRAKPPPSKWDDAQKWLTGFSGGGGGGGGGAQHKCKPRNSNADDRRLLPSHSQRARDSCSSIEGALDYDCAVAVAVGYSQEEGETKKIDCNELFLKAQNRNPNPVEESAVGVRSVFLRDMGTEMTPIASKEPSRTGTPMRASTPISSRSSTPGRVRQGGAPVSERSGEAAVAAANYGRANGNGWVGRGGGEADCVEKLENSVSLAIEASSNSLESRAMAWDEAERAKYMARYKREEVKIQAWENHEKRKAEMEMKKIEVKAERMKSRAQEKLANKLASTRRIAEEKRTSAEAKLNERAARTSERADYIRRTGHLPSSFFSFKLPSLCG